MTSKVCSEAGREAISDDRLDDILNEHWNYQGVPSVRHIINAMRAAVDEGLVSGAAVQEPALFVAKSDLNKLARDKTFHISAIGVREGRFNTALYAAPVPRQAEAMPGDLPKLPSHITDAIIDYGNARADNRDGEANADLAYAISAIRALLTASTPATTAGALDSGEPDAAQKAEHLESYYGSVVNGRRRDRSI